MFTGFPSWLVVFFWDMDNQEMSKKTKTNKTFLSYSEINLNVTENAFECIFQTVAQVQGNCTPVVIKYLILCNILLLCKESELLYKL